MNPLSNKFNLPQPVVSALAKDDYDIGDADISVTSLWKPPQMVGVKNAVLHEIELEGIGLGRIVELRKPS